MRKVLVTSKNSYEAKNNNIEKESQSCSCNSLHSNDGEFSSSSLIPYEVRFIDNYTDNYVNNELVVNKCQDVDPPLLGRTKKEIWDERDKIKNKVLSQIKKALWEGNFKNGFDKNKELMIKTIKKMDDCLYHFANYVCPESGLTFKGVKGRCTSRVCPHCNAMYSRKLQSKYSEILEKIKNPKFLTLTIVNVEELNQNIYKDLRKTWNDLRVWLKKTYGLKGGVYVIETTYQTEQWRKSANTWHPHLHVILDWREDEVYSDEELKEAIKGKWIELTRDNKSKWIKESDQIDFCSAVNDSIKELFKYSIKFQDNVPYAEYLVATHQVKLVMSFGSIKGEISEKAIEDELKKEIESFNETVETHDNDSPDSIFIASTWVEEVKYRIDENGKEIEASKEKKMKYFKKRACPCGCGGYMELVLLSGEKIPDHRSFEDYKKRRDKRDQIEAERIAAKFVREMEEKKKSKNWLTDNLIDFEQDQYSGLVR